MRVALCVQEAGVYVPRVRSPAPVRSPAAAHVAAAWACRWAWGARTALLASGNVIQNYTRAGAASRCAPRVTECVLMLASAALMYPLSGLREVDFAETSAPPESEGDASRCGGWPGGPGAQARAGDFLGMPRSPEGSTPGWRGIFMHVFRPHGVTMHQHTHQTHTHPIRKTVLQTVLTRIDVNRNEARVHSIQILDK